MNSRYNCIAYGQAINSLSTHKQLVLIGAPVFTGAFFKHSLYLHTQPFECICTKP